MAPSSNFSGKAFTDRPPADLIKILVSQLNGCAFCLDMHAKDLLLVNIIAINGWNRLASSTGMVPGVAGYSSAAPV
ncbi:carboxymuconolactone decarboxylase family protein [Paenibacillus tengchongensis]|uniref:carboxymuconolactone decarboxylase family protein n=1 Tax=Paenibacillus tengchongensis TaxID=2608684 RepID=UPI00124D77F6|nr:carboxymuconolactone decarboxylase family protein [Paenibacillus tengchongensis]